MCPAACESGELKSLSAGGHRLISKSGSNVSLAEEEEEEKASEGRVSVARRDLKGLRRIAGL